VGRELVDILDSLDGRGIPYRKSGKSGEIFLCCPFCLENNQSQDERFRLGINIETGQAHCFNCDWRTSDITYLSQELSRALEMDMFERGEVVPKKFPPIHLPEDFQILSFKDKDHWGRKAYQYVKLRNVTDRQMTEKKLGYSLSGDFHHRIVVPVYYQGKLKGLVGRDFTGKQEPKYKNSIGIKVVYNVPRRKAQTGLLVEGIFDSLACERGCGGNTVHGSVDSLGVLGHSLTDKQLEQLQGYKRFVLWPDPDKAGVFGFLGMIPDLKRITSQIYIVKPRMAGRDDFDPSEMFGPEIKRRINQATAYSVELEQRLRAWLAFREEE